MELMGQKKQASDFQLGRASRQAILAQSGAMAKRARPHTKSSSAQK